MNNISFTMQKLKAKLRRSDNSDPLNTSKSSKPKRKAMWPAVTILMVIIVVVVLVSWILSWAGVHVDVPVEGTEHEYTSEAIQGLGIFDIFLLPLKGFEKQIEIIVFLLMIGVFMMILINSKALEAFSQNIVRKMHGREVYAIIPLMMFFAVCGSIQGMCEETLAFYPIIIPLMLMAGFDTFTSILIVCIGAGIGVLGATLDPFAVSVAIKQYKDLGIENVSISDGLIWRLLLWVLATTAAIGFTFRYAWRIKKNPQLSVSFATLEGDKQKWLHIESEQIRMDWRKKVTIATFIITFIFMLFFMISWDTILGLESKTLSEGFSFYALGEWMRENLWFLSFMMPAPGDAYLLEVSTFFLLGSIFMAVVNKVGHKGYIQNLTAGMSDFIGVAIVCATAAGVTVALDKSNIQYLVTGGIKSIFEGLGNSYLQILVLFLLFIPFSFLIPSTSGFATLMFPLLVDTVNMNPEVLVSGSILAFIAANGLVNLCSPIAIAVVMPLQIIDVSYGTYIKKIAPLLLGLVVIIIVVLMSGVAVAEASSNPIFA